MTIGTTGPERLLLGHAQGNVTEDDRGHVKKAPREPLVGRALASGQNFGARLTRLCHVRLHQLASRCRSERPQVRLGVGQAGPHGKRGRLLREPLDELICHRTFDEKPVDRVA